MIRPEDDDLPWCDECTSYHARGTHPECARDFPFTAPAVKEHLLKWRVLPKDPPPVMGGQGHDGEEIVDAGFWLGIAFLFAAIAAAACALWSTLP